PILTSAAAKSSTEIDLVWSASSDNVGVAGYQLTRSGSVLTSTSALSFADTTVKAGTSYTYFVKAYDAAGNYSNASNTIQVTTPSTPTAAATVTAVSVTPSSGSGASQTFAVALSDTNGYANINLAEIDISANLTG